MTRKLLPVLCLFLLAAARAAFGADVRFELGFGWALVGPSLNARYVNQYHPPFNPPANYFASSAEQHVSFKGKTAYGMNGSFNVLFTDSLGLQVLADYHRPGIGGSSAPYTVTAQFQAFQPETHITELGALESKGGLTETTFGLNALVRFRVADNLSISASAGPSVFYFEGQAGFIDYTFYDLTYAAGVYTLRYGTYHMAVDFGPQTNFGLNIGVEAAYEATRNVILALDLRWYGAAKSDQQMRLVEDDVITQPLDQIEAAIGLGTISVDPSYIRAGLALRIVF